MIWKRSVRRTEANYDPFVSWLDNNRNRGFEDISNPECNLDNKYELVIGPVADDDLALLFRQFSGGLINVEELTEEMKFKKLTTQYSFHSERAIRMLKKVEEYHG